MRARTRISRCCSRRARPTRSTTRRRPGSGSAPASNAPPPLPYTTPSRSHAQPDLGDSRGDHLRDGPRGRPAQRQQLADRRDLRLHPGGRHAAQCGRGPGSRGAVHAEHDRRGQLHDGDPEAEAHPHQMRPPPSPTRRPPDPTPSLTWATPAAITYGTALGDAQLNASSSLTGGTFAYTPAAGMLLNAGADQDLAVLFTPSTTDAVNYTTATRKRKRTRIKCAPPPPLHDALPIPRPA